jgi:hypothetical protein
MGIFLNNSMSLEDQINQTLDNFENTPSERFLEILNQIKPQFKSELISEYLQGKIQKILDADNEPEKKKQCKALTPYLDWYLSGL